MTLSEDVYRYTVWGGAVAFGCALAVVDRTWIGKPVLSVGLILAAIAGAVGIQVSPSAFQSGDYAMMSLLVLGGALLALSGYASVVAGFALSALINRGRKP